MILNTEILLKWQLNQYPMPKDYYATRRLDRIDLVQHTAEGSSVHILRIICIV